MDQRSYDYWRKIYADFRSSGFTVEKYCRQKHLNSRWFERQRHDAEAYEQHINALPEVNDVQIPDAESLFVELIPEQSSSAIPTADAPALRLSYREVNFELPSGFSSDVFRQALSVIRETL